MQHAFTIDFEDWYQGIGLPITEWKNFEKRLHIGYDFLMNLLSKHNIKATFFILGQVFENHPYLVEEIYKEGHEIGCHSYSHPFIFNLTPDQFSAEVKKCIRAGDAFGIRYKGFRAPYFSIDERNLWALDILQEHDFTYDSSIYPGDNKRTGIQNYTKEIHQLKNSLWEVPISTFRVMKYDVGLGGAFFRILPYRFFKKSMEDLTKTRPGIFYIHPWELDEKHPKINGLTPRIRYPHYFNLSSTKRKLNQLVKDFSFTTLENVLQQQQAYTHECT
ncbi:MAG: polysaccharide deacetylase [Flavisolibacter sp.]|nr:polysaccharide deacetylase [Flavisolibacter sp.]